MSTDASAPRQSTESFSDQIARLEMMADPDDAKWDLSDNDRAAIRALLENYRAAVTEHGK